VHSSTQEKAAPQNACLAVEPQVRRLILVNCHTEPTACGISTLRGFLLLSVSLFEGGRVWSDPEVMP
jgi:hypothetical protein